MPKVPLNDLSSLSNETTAISTINNNNATIEAGFNNTLSRDGTSPNTMEAQLDMNQNRLVNIPTVPTSNTEAASKYYVDYMVGNTIDTTPTNPSDAVIEGNLTVGGTITGSYSSLAISSASPFIQMTDTDVTGITLISGSSSVGSLKLAADTGNTLANSRVEFYVDTDTVSTSKVFIDATSIAPGTSDGSALGKTTNGWSDLFIASGGVINWNNGTYTLIQNGTDLTASGGFIASSLKVDTSAYFQIQSSNPILNFDINDYYEYNRASNSLAFNIGGSPVMTQTSALVTIAPTLYATGTIELGNASDTTLARSSAGNVSIEGNVIYRAGGTDVTVSDGGTGVSSNTAYAVLCGGTTSTGPVQSIASVGSSGQVLTSNGAGALPTFQNAASGSALVQLISGTFSSSATASFVISSYTAYRCLVFHLQSVVPSIGSQMLFRVSTDGGASYDSGTNYQYGGRSFGSDGTNNSISSTGDSSIKMSPTAVETAAASGGGNIILKLFDASSTARRTRVIYECTWVEQTSGTIYCVHGAGERTATQDTDAVRFLFSSGNIASGSYSIYGLL